MRFVWVKDIDMTCTYVNRFFEYLNIIYCIVDFLEGITIKFKFMILQEKMKFPTLTYLPQMCLNTLPSHPTCQFPWVKPVRWPRGCPDALLTTTKSLNIGWDVEFWVLLCVAIPSDNFFPDVSDNKWIFTMIQNCRTK